jgi:putative acetyltransferase
MKIRPECPADVAAIRGLVMAAFKGVPYGDGTEAAIVDALRHASALSLSLVAEVDGEVVAHVAFSPVTIDGAQSGWYGLGPAAVRPDRQRHGIGQALIRSGLERIRELGARGCVVLGDPAYYARFGFRSDPNLRYGDVPPAHFQLLAFDEERPNGRVAFHPAFGPS